MPKSNALREQRPYRWLLLAVLFAVVLVQIVWMVSLTRSQVEKAQRFYAAEHQGTSAASTQTSATASQRAVEPGGLLSVSYVSAR